MVITNPWEEDCRAVLPVVEQGRKRDKPQQNEEEKKQTVRTGKEPEEEEGEEEAEEEASSEEYDDYGIEELRPESVIEEVRNDNHRKHLGRLVLC